MADAGSLWARLGLDDSKFNQGIDRAEKKTNGLATTVKRAGAAIAGAFAARAIYRGISKIITGLTEQSDRLLDLSDITDMTTDTLQEYGHVASIAGVNSEAVANAAQNLTNRFQNLHREQSPVARAFRELNIQAYDASGNLQSTGAIMDQLIPKLANLSNATERNALGAQLFGGSWKDMAPILGMGAAGIKEARMEAHRLGIVLDKESIEKANEFRQEQEKLKAATGELTRDFGLLLIPMLTRVAGGFTDLTQDVKSFWDEYIKAPEWEQKDVDLPAAYVEQQEKLMETGAVLQKHFEDQAAAKKADNKATEEAEMTLREYRERIKEIGTELDNLQPSQKDQIDALLKERTELEGVVEAALERKDAMERPVTPSVSIDNILEAARAHDQATEAMRNEADALFGLDNAYRQLDETLAVSAEAVDRNIKRFDTAKQATIDWENIMVSGAANIGMGLMELAQNTETSVGDIIKNLTRQVTAMLIAEIWSSPEIPSFWAKLAMSAGAGAIAGTLMQGLADGGTVNESGVFKVGERGPEYLTLPAGAKVTPNDKMMPSGGALVNFRFIIEDDIIVGAANRFNKRRDNFG